MSDKVRAIKVLEIEDVKIYESEANHASVKTRGNLEVLYTAEFDRFILQVNSFKYVLSTYLPVMACLFEARAFRSYIFPSITGHYIMKLKSVPPLPVVKNLETMFANYSQFSYQQGQETQLEAQINKVTPEQTDRITQASKYIKAGGEIIKQNVIKAANFLDKNLIQPKKTGTSVGPNQEIVRTIQELKGLNNPHSTFIDIPRFEVVGLITISNQIEKKFMSQNEQNMMGKMQLQPEKGNWPVLAKTTKDSAVSIWEGMEEALSILYKSVQAKRAKNLAEKTNNPTPFQKMNQKDQVELENHLPQQVISNQQQLAQPVYQPNMGYQSGDQAFQQNQLGGMQYPSKMNYPQDAQPLLGREILNPYLEESGELISNDPNRARYPDLNNTATFKPIPEDQANLNRYPNLNRDIRGQVNVSQPQANVDRQYSDATTQAHKFTNTYSSTHEG